MKKCGDTLRFRCNVCNKEFAVTAEPDYKGNLPDKYSVEYCPFCGEDMPTCLDEE